MMPTDELEDYPLRKRGRIITIVVAGALAISLVFYGLVRPAPEEARESSLPEFNLPLLGGGDLTDNDLRGQPVVLNFWASWCIPCRDEAPLLQEVAARYRAEGVRVIGVNIQDTEDGARSFVDEFDISYEILRDADQSLAKALGVKGLPVTFFIDRQGRFLGREAGSEIGTGRGGTEVLGAISEEQLTEQIERLLEPGRLAAEVPGEPEFPALFDG